MENKKIHKAVSLNTQMFINISLILSSFLSFLRKLLVVHTVLKGQARNHRDRVKRRSHMSTRIRFYFQNLLLEKLIS